VLETRPLEGINKTPEIIELKPELPPPVQTPVEPYAAQPGQIQENLPEPQPELFPDQPVDNTTPPIPDQPAEPQPNAEQAVPQEAPQPVPEAPPQAETFTPLEQLPPQTPAVNALVLAANDNSQAGNLDSAVSSIERAIRIEPRNAALYYKLAVIRLKQSKPRLAEDLARKAALLAVKDTTLKKHSWLLIANAREQQNNSAGANEAKAEAAKY
jgi:tetratricopeptide (TPR) repeat protein